MTTTPLTGDTWGDEIERPRAYILKEAEVLHSGERLGPVGSHIVAGTKVALLKAQIALNDDVTLTPIIDPVHGGRVWSPRDWIMATNDFKMAHLLFFAGVVNPLG